MHQSSFKDKSRGMTTPSYRLIAPQANRSFVFKWEPFDLTTRWHYHPELELIYFIEGRTTGIMGDGFQPFEAGDLVLLGANFPHVLQEDSSFVREHPHAKPFGLIVQFRANFLGAEFLQKPETGLLHQLFIRASRGLHFSKPVSHAVTGTLLHMCEQSEPGKLISLLQVLLLLAETEDFDYLTPKEYTYDTTQDETRMHNIHQYVYKHFKTPISIAQIAAIANMTETSFCRYFKTRTLKTFTRFLNETRIAYACRMLNKSSCSITEVCFESGFTNLSYFNRQFRQVVKMSPLHYRKWKRSATQ
jgi:AraC-like DNA-binding protein